MKASFHLSIPVTSISDSLHFFTKALKAKVHHQDPSGYVNIDLFGTQITLKENSRIPTDLTHFHFGVNLQIQEFENIVEHIYTNFKSVISMEPKIYDKGTLLERKKMYLKSPTGYLIELKGY